MSGSRLRYNDKMLATRRGSFTKLPLRVGIEGREVGSSLTGGE